VAFSPTATGSITGSVAIASNATGSPATLAVSGSGVQLITHNANLSWIPSTSTVAGYQVYSSNLSGGPYAKLTPSAVNLASYTDSTVQSGKTYYYVVTAVDSSSMESVYSNQVSALIP
jgi:fibronectin type 3 domain-containing protein